MAIVADGPKRELLEQVGKMVVPDTDLLVCSLNIAFVCVCECVCVCVSARERERECDQTGHDGANERKVATVHDSSSSKL